MFPISTHRRDAQIRWDSLETGISFLALEDHVRAKRPTPGTCHAYQPSFIGDKRIASWHRDVRALRTEQAATLEKAIALCTAASALEPKPLATLTASIAAHYRDFDVLAAREIQIIQQRHEDRVKGGKARQDRVRPAREYAVRLFKTMRPAEGWKSLAAAARAIAPHVENFVFRHRLSVFAGSSPLRTIHGWLREAQFTV